MNEQHPSGTAAQQPAATPSTLLRGPWRGLAWGVWFALAALSLLYVVPSVRPTYDQALYQDVADAGVQLWQLGISPDVYALYITGLSLLVWLSFTTVATVLFWCKSDDWGALFASLTLMVVGASFAFKVDYWRLEFSFMLWQVPVDPVAVVSLITLLALGSSLLLFYLFPSGQFVPHWTRFLATAWIAWTIATYFFFDEYNQWLEGRGLAWPLGLLPWLAWYGTGVFAQIYRYVYVSGPVKRQQTKWVLFGLAAPVVWFAVVFLFELLRPWLALLLPASILEWIGALLFYGYVENFSLLLIPVTMGIAVLRLRLWDIDPLINRTLVYSTLTVLLTLMYIGSIVALQQFFRALTGQASQLAIIASTLAIIALFNPLRRRIQGFIDRRFYRRKYDAAKTLEAFSMRLRNEPDLDALSNDLLAVVEETLQPTHVSLGLREPPVQAQGQRGEGDSA